MQPRCHFLHLPSWLEALNYKENNSNKLYNEMWDYLNPNDENAINNNQLVQQIEYMWKTLKDSYKNSMREWHMKIGSSLGNLSIYSDFRRRDPGIFSRYNKQLGSMLTQIYILNISLGNAFSGKY